jgi:hypothetical protein
MPRLRVGVVRYASVGNAIARALGVDPPPECRIGQGRISLIFRGLGASRWPEERQIEYALRVARTAREIISVDSRRTIRNRRSRAIVVVYEDNTLVRGCAVTSKWECVVPGGEHDA